MLPKLIIETMPLCDGMYEVQVWDAATGEIQWRRHALGLEELTEARREACRWANRTLAEVEAAWREREYDWAGVN